MKKFDLHCTSDKILFQRVVKYEFSSLSNQNICKLQIIINIGRYLEIYRDTFDTSNIPTFEI